MNEMVLTGRGLVKEYAPGGARALDGFDIEVARGSIFALLGRNGAGKTTALRVFAGLLKPSAGRAEVLGRDPWGMPPDIRRRVGFLAARPAVYPWLTVGEAIDLVADLHGERFDRAGADALAKRLELARASKVGELSLGLKRRLGLLIAVAPRPDLLLLDEPAGGLDPIARREMLEIILELVRSRGTTVVYSTHILSDVERVAGEVGFVAKGRLALSRSLDDLKESFRRVRVAFDASPDLARILSEKGVVDARTDGTEALVTTDVEGGDEAVAALAARLAGRLTGSFPMDLEEIYLAVMRREKVEVTA